MTYRHYAYTEKSKLSLLKFSKSVLAVLLALLMVLSSLFLLRNFFVTADAAILSEGQTAFKNVSQFQKYRWAQIQNKIFGTDPGTQQNPKVYNPSAIMNSEVKLNNGYFDWVPESALTGADAWDGNNNPSNNIRPADKTDDYDYDGDGTAEVKYTVYNVKTAEQFRYVLSNINSGITAQYVKLNLLSDLNMAGYEGKRWSPIETEFCKDKDFKKYLYIEGNGHTIYNLRIYTADTKAHKGAGLFSRPPAFMIAKNLGFRSSMVVNASKDSQFNMVAGLISAFAPQKYYFYNIHSSGGYYQVYADGKESDGGIGGLIGRKNMNPAAIDYNSGIQFLSSDLGDGFMKNCSTEKSYMYGSDHIGGLTSWFGTEYEANDCKYNSDFPDVPEQCVLDQQFVKNLSKTSTREYIQQYNHYPLMFENCSSTDCEIYSTGHDSGALISCGRGLLVRNSFTNNKIYAIDNTGGFIGRLGTDRFSKVKFGIFHDDNNNCSLTDYFENCYSSGVVEGKEAMGGFVGLDNSARARRTIYNSATDSDVLNNTGKAARASSAFVNCYSTAMVGMDYAGKYCGGFIGLDDNYNQGFIDNGNIILPKITVPNLINDSGEKSISGCGNFYVNCYSGGEVGNILTITDTKDAAEKETLYLNDKNTGEGANAIDSEGNPAILDYYPTGGFVGAIGVEGYKKDFTFNNVKINPVGNFYNCYYDMQTTAMHEMAVGLANVQTYRDYKISLDSTNTDSDSANTDKPKFRLTGVTGLYTVDSDVKKVPGLTGSPKSYEGSKSVAMDNAKENSTVWTYNNEYYPQLKIFMSSDTTLSDITQASDSDVLIDRVTNSPFFIEETSNNVANESHPVMSMANQDNSTINTNLRAAQLAGVVYPYRYSQASTSTVLLDHWDYTMDTESGESADDTTAWGSPGLEQNKMIKNDEGEWVKEYTNLKAGRYEFKVQAGQSLSYNYGRTKFDDTENIVLNVPSDNCNVKLRFKYEKIKSSDFYVIAEITDENGVTTVETLTSPATSEYKVVKYTVAGSLPDNNWNANSNDKYTMTYMGDEKTYTLSMKDLPVGDYQFKITDGGGWTNNWGQGGKAGGNNMSFSVVNGSADVKITFDESTKKCTVTADPTANLANVVTDEKLIDFSGYSVITSSNQITGYEWLATKEGKEKEAAEAGKLTMDVDTGLYEATFTLHRYDGNNVSNFEHNYAYKIIKDAVDSGENSGFYVGTPEDESINEIQLKFTYNPVTGETTVTSNPSGFVKGYYKAETYSVVGDKNLTGYEWLENEDAGIIGQMEPDGSSGTDYKKVYTDIKPGTYSFKVLPDCLDGKWSSPVSYGDPTKPEGNYVFTVLDEVKGQKVTDTTVTIRFDSTTGKIRVTTTPVDCIEKGQYVLMGPENLMKNVTGSDGEPLGEWNKNEPLMEYDEDSGKYFYTIKNVEVNDGEMQPSESYLANFNYSFKVIEKGKDRGENQRFVLGGKLAIQQSYDLKFCYDPYTRETEVLAYDEDGNEVTGEVISYNAPIYFYSVLGEESLTGYDWGVSHASEAAFYGWLNDSDGDGILEKEYKINVPTDGSSAPYSFKVAANGTFASGRSWGSGGLDDNDNFIVSVSSTNPDVSTATLQIRFNPETGEVSFFTDPENVLDDEHADDNFQWYIYGESSLKSNNAFKYDVTVYDTVRDITSGFTFTCGQGSAEERGLTWSIDQEYNKASEFKDTANFNMSYSQNYKHNDNAGNAQSENIEINGTFESNVVPLKVQPIQETGFESEFGLDNILAQYYVEKCMPGKQWLKVTTAGYGASETFIQWKKDYLAYFDYVEKNNTYEKYFKRYLSILQGRDYPESAEKVVSENNLINYCYANPSIDAEVAQGRLKLPEGTTLTTLYETKEACERKTKPDSEYPSIANQSIIGSRYLRLIPTSYLEAGNDANINVVQSQSDATGEKAVNYVKYEAENSDNGTSFTMNNGDFGSQPFNYYNFAVTAAYMCTDKVGLGIYNNYNENRVTTFNQRLIRDDDDPNVRNSSSDGTGKNYRYFGMSSAYNNTDGLGTASYSDGGDRTTANLTIGEFVDESIIGNSRSEDKIVDDETVNQKAKTIVKVFKKNITDTGDEVLNLVNVDKNNTGTIYGSNYQKWTGQKKFTVADQGTYTISFYWTLSDGRYLKDSKDVDVTVVQPGLTKTVDKKYDGTGKNNELTYTVSYTNNETNDNLRFALLDILPFNNSTRSHTEGEGESAVTESDTTRDNGNNLKYNIESMNLTFTNDSTIIKGIYYSQSGDIGTALNPDSDSAAKLSLSNDGMITGNFSSYFNLINKNMDGNGTTYNPDLGVKDTEIAYSAGMRYNKISNVTALAITGLELGIGESITLEFKLNYNGDKEDYYVNDASFYVQSKENEAVKVANNCNPVSTAIVARDITGYAFLDDNRNGIKDTNDRIIPDMTVNLYKEESDAVYMTTKTGSDGMYTFSDIPAGNYIIKFEPGESGKVTYKDISGTSKTVDFSLLNVSPTKIETENGGMLDGSRNLFTANIENDASTGEKKLLSAEHSVTMPKNDQVYYQNYSTKVKINSTTEKGVYIKTIQNSAFYVDDYDYSMAISKVDQDGNPVKGVGFMLEYKVEKEIITKDDEGNEVVTTESGWYPVYYEGTGDSKHAVYNSVNPKTIEQLENEGKEYILYTDEQGNLLFDKLFAAEYRFTEVSTPAGSNIGKLQSAVYFSLPYQVPESELEEYAKKYYVDVNANDNTDDYVLKDGIRYYKNVKFKVSNPNNQFNLPQTGAGFDGLYIALLAGLVLLGAGITVFVLSKKKKRGTKKI